MSYSVRYRPLGSEDPQAREVNGIPPTTTQILLEALDKWTEYRITTVAHTEVGPGPESSPVVVRTDEDGEHREPPRWDRHETDTPAHTRCGRLGWLGGHEPGLRLTPGAVPRALLGVESALSTE